MYFGDLILTRRLERPRRGDGREHGGRKSHFKGLVWEKEEQEGFGELKSCGSEGSRKGSEEKELRGPSRPTPEPVPLQALRWEMGLLRSR